MADRLFLEASVRELERRACAALPAMELMRRAGLAAADWASTLVTPGERILALVGPGNNGGDASVAAAALAERGYPVHVALCADPASLPPDARRAWDALPASVHRHGSPERAPAPALILDGLFGIGLKRPLAAPYDGWVHWANAQPCKRLALDVPSGLAADQGCALGEAVLHATHTLTFLALKPGLFTADGPDLRGELRLARLGVDAQALGVPGDGELLQASGFADVLTQLHRRANTHKGSYGSVGIIGGAAGMVGAALLAGRASLKLGAGRVFVGFIDAAHPAVDPVQPELMLRAASDLCAHDAPVTAFALGPGLGQSDAARAALREALQRPWPAVVDADALNVIAASAEARSWLLGRTAPTVLTPHPLEAARLLAITASAVQADRIAAACRLARETHCIVVLKGQGSIVAEPDGCWAINPTGHAGLASGGTGDVLTGIVAALLAQSVRAPAAARLAAWVHGLAAERLAEDGVGPIGLAAGELIDAARHLLNEEVLNAALRGRSETGEAPPQDPNRP